MHEVHLGCNCKGLFLRQLRRFPNLHRLVLGGNAASVHWEGATPVLRTLRGGLRLDCRSQAQYDADVELEGLPNGIDAALAAATGVTALELVDAWSDDVRTLSQTCAASSK